MITKLCEICGRPLWNELCGYCKGYEDGVIDTKKRKINKEIYKCKKRIDNYVFYQKCETNPFNLSNNLEIIF